MLKKDKGDPCGVLYISKAYSAKVMRDPRPCHYLYALAFADESLKVEIHPYGHCCGGSSLFADESLRKIRIRHKAVKPDGMALEFCNESLQMVRM